MHAPDIGGPSLTSPIGALIWETGWKAEGKGGTVQSPEASLLGTDSAEKGGAGIWMGAGEY